jgi:tripartite-type tricarboxylate transporter receptor subunit TctC
VQKALDVPAVKERFARLGAEQMRQSIEEFEKYFHADVADIAKLVKAANIPTQQRN